MLYDPKWSGLSVAGFAAWADQKDPRETYLWCVIDGRCAVDQFLTAIGRDRRPCGDHEHTTVMELERLAMEHPRNFGALATRAIEKAAAVVTAGTAGLSK